MNQSKYIVGIDLGTSNSILAYTPAEMVDEAASEIQILEIPQITGPGSVAARPMLPSFIFLPGEKDMSPDALSLPWEKDVKQVVGEFARERGAELPQRLISSAKSWLCHPMVDRNQAILPWGASPEVPKLSTVEASAAILDHIRRAWNHEHGDAPEPARLTGMSPPRRRARRTASLPGPHPVLGFPIEGGLMRRLQLQ